MKRKDAINHIRIAGYHQDSASFVRLYVENRVSRQVANEAYANGVKQREAGIKCNCYECKRGE